MKSAYEIALERMAREGGPVKTLTNDQKARIAEIDRKYDAKIAEVKLSYEARIAGAKNVEELETFRRELAEKTASLEAQRAAEKDAVWNEA